MRGGIRMRITAIAVTVVTFVVVLAGVLLLFAQQRLLTQSIDEILNTQNSNVERTWMTGDESPVIVQQGDIDAIAQVVDAGGNVLASTANFASQPALPSPDGETSLHNSDLVIDESTYRILSRRIDGVVIHTGTPIDDVEEAFNALRSGLIVAIPTMTLVIGLLIWWLVGRTLRPVETIRTQVAEISGGNLERRVPVPGSDDEVARLARTMNEMLARLQEASERQQRFVGDASHELRSPLTRMRAELDVDLSHPSTADHEATHRSVLEEVGNLERLVDDLLHLARAEPTGVPGRFDVVVDLAALVEREARRQEGAGQEIDTRGLTPAVVHGDPAQLARMVRNLADNASRHATNRMRFETDQHDDVVALIVSDDGPGVPEADRDRVFERFARLDEARSSASGGTGLGLAIVRDIVVRHGGTIRVDSSDDGGARFVVLFPRIAEV